MALFVLVLLASAGQCFALTRSNANPTGCLPDPNIPVCKQHDPLCATCSADSKTCVTCAKNTYSSGGKCCPFGTTNCAGVCTLTAFCNQNCGGCGHVCQTVSHGFDQCLFGQCELVCGKGYTKCGSACTTPNSDVANCGSCGHKCSAPANSTATCSQGACDFTCNSGFTRCGGSCVNLQTTTSNCGSCGNVCPAPTPGSTAAPVCNMGKCALQCTPPTTLCGTSCVNTATDPSSCGACNNQCSGPTNGNGAATCTGGSCGITCQSGYTPCQNACVTTGSDPSNCGACGNVCASGSCASGRCVQSLLFTFDELPSTITPVTTYQGFTFTNFYAFTPSSDGYGPDSGYAKGVVSQPNVAFLGNGNAASFAPTTGGPFNVVSVYATAAFTNPYTVTFTALDSQMTPTASFSATINDMSPTQITFPPSIFSSIYGFTVAGGDYVAFDNFAVLY